MPNIHIYLSTCLAGIYDEAKLSIKFGQSLSGNYGVDQFAGPPVQSGLRRSRRQICVHKKKTHLKRGSEQKWTLTCPV